MKLITTIRLFAIAGLATLAASGFAQSPTNSERPGKQGGQGMQSKGNREHRLEQTQQPNDLGRRYLAISQQLNLTDVQEQEILKLSQAFRGDMAKVRKSNEQSRKQLQDLKKSGNVDESALRAALQAAQPGMIEAQVLMARYHASLSGVLTDEQKNKLSTLREKMQQRQPREGRSKSAEGRSKTGAGR